MVFMESPVIVAHALMIFSMDGSLTVLLTHESKLLMGEPRLSLPVGRCPRSN
jgi:hypothetical protein